MAVKDYAVISLHENGHWVVAVYWKMGRAPIESDVANHLKTFKVGEDREAPLSWCRDWYPNAEVIISN